MIATRRARLAILAGLGVIFLLANLLPLLWEKELNGALDNDIFVWNYKIDRLREGKLRGVELLVLGDSQAMSGILTGRLLSHPEKGYNLGLPAQQPEGVLSLLQLLKREAPRLRVIILNVNPFSMFQSDVHNAFLNYYRSELLIYASRPLLQEPGLAGKTAGEWLDRSFQILPLYRMRGRITPLFSFEENLLGIPLSTIRGHRPMTAPAGSDRLFLRGWSPRELYTVRAWQNGRIASILAEHYGFWTWKSFQIPASGDCQANIVEALPGGGKRYVYPRRKNGERAWRLLFEELSRTSYQVYVVQIPFSRSWQRAVDSRRVYQELNHRLDIALRGLPAIRRIDLPAEWRDNDTLLFYDWTHLSYCGAIQYSEWLRRRISGP